jgi:hypothetical protein
VADGGDDSRRQLLLHGVVCQPAQLDVGERAVIGAVGLGGQLDCPGQVELARVVEAPGFEQEVFEGLRVDARGPPHAAVVAHEGRLLRRALWRAQRLGVAARAGLVLREGGERGGGRGGEDAEGDRAEHGVAQERRDGATARARRYRRRVAAALSRHSIE